MKQILQNLSDGKTELVNVPVPGNKKGFTLIKSSCSLLSIGTEKMLINFGKSNLINKAKSQPDKVKMVVSKVKTDGLVATYNSVKSKLDQPLPLGYCNVGRVVESDSTKLQKGTRVVSNGYHAEYVRVPHNLVAKIPDNVTDQEASFTVLGSIALQGIRLLKPNIGETYVVTGLGLIGLLSVQILIANGCKVIGIDFDSKKCKLAKEFGANVVNLSEDQDALSITNSLTSGNGVDGVLITASSSSNEIISQAANMCRKRGKIVLIGVVGLEINRADFYEKEISFQVSCSYGPGRYDSNYEESGNDYPFGFVRWTEQRNFEAILELMSSKKIKTETLISQQYKFENATEAYSQLDSNDNLGVVLNYSIEDNASKLETKIEYPVSNNLSKINLAVIGSGNYASRILIPEFSKTVSNMHTLISSGGITGAYHGKKHGFQFSSTNFEDALHKDIDTIVIATRHNLHASQTIAALEKNKNVFVEKPLALNINELNKIKLAKEKSKSTLMVGYNRRFSPHVKKIKYLLKNKPQPKTISMLMNPGMINEDHWTQDEKVGGGRIIGEACHYIDLMRYIIGHKITSYSAKSIGENIYENIKKDKSIITISFEDGSVGVIQYFANGASTFPKERVEIFCDGGIIQLDNFKKMKAYNWQNFNQMNFWKQNKGQTECVNKFIESILSKKATPLIPFDELFEVAEVTININEILELNA